MVSRPKALLGEPRSSAEATPMKGFQVTGSYDASRVGYRQSIQNFSVQVAAADENAAREKVLSELGSKHRKKRGEITLTAIKPLAAADVTDPIVKHQIGEK